ncbi:MAG: hypothetical protein ACTH8V_13775 [Brachybacterium tyrofermentans]
MTFLHLLVLALGVAAAVIAADLLGHRDIGPWPVGLVALLMFPVAGWFYSPWLAALALGLGLGASAVITVSWARSVIQRRHERRTQARDRDRARTRQLEKHPLRKL